MSVIPISVDVRPDRDVGRWGLAIERWSKGKLSQTRVIFLGILLAGAVLRFYNLGQPSLWFDEVASVEHARFRLRDLFSVNPSDWMPPLYAILLHCWLNLGTSEWIVRTPSVIFGIAGLAVMFRLGALLFSKRVGLWVAALLAFSPGHILFSQEARGYSLLVFLTLLSTYFLVRALCEQHKTALWLYILTTVLIFYTHYLAPLLLAFQVIFVLIQFHRVPAIPKRPWVISSLLIGIACMPLLFHLIHYVALWPDPTQGIRPGIFPPLNLPILFAQFVVGPYLPPTAALLSGLPASLILFIRGCRNAFASFQHHPPEGRYPDVVLLVFLWFAVPTSMLAVLWGGGGYYLLWFRYALISLPAFLLILALGLPGTWRGSLGPLVFAALMVASGLAIQKNYQIPHKPDWRGLTRFIHRTGTPEDFVIFASPSDRRPFDFYYELASRGGRLRPFVLWGIGQARVWYVASGKNPPDLELGLERSLGGQYRKVEQSQFHWLRAALYHRE